MDNKRWYSRFGTIFWWCLAILPLIITLIYFIGYHLTFNSGITSALELSNYHSNSQGDFLYYLYTILTNSNITFDMYVPSFIYDMYYNLFDIFGLNGDYYILSALFGWMTSVAFYHVVFDFSVWIFNWIHSLFERWGCFK